MPVLKVKDASGVWLDIAGVGSPGPSGGPVPVGGNVGEVLVKTGPADFEVEWQPQRPRTVFSSLIGTVTSGAVNVMHTLITGPCDIDPTRNYLIMAGIRCIQDPGAVVPLAQARVNVGQQLEGYDVWVSPDTGLWGAWHQHWWKTGASLNGTGATVSVTATLDLQLNVASKTVYAPRLTVIEF
jgi:hypothetical protein